ncbi:MAG TPA: ABC transporter ATP-binding protein [Victivallales bacterium]|nr:ABC transporter ATP-binding protein [Victivallales bacterium]HPO91208.1 ABC transporter ATP-binding protein [Victivallales bacterium]HRR29302.1 ABC transporter ATP-binding protein [Victivallales bacterium]
MSNDIIISIKNVKKSYNLKEETVWALAGVSLEIKKGEYISIMGPSGSGKSTLFNMIGGLDMPSEGEVLIDGMRLDKMNQKQLAYVRCKKIGYIFQTFNLIPVMTAVENVMLPMTFSGIPDNEARKRAEEILSQIGLDSRFDHLPGQLSGGQQQRVAVARALANTPSILLADEPTGNLDLKTGEDLINTLKSLKDKLGVTVISATHDHKMLAASDRVVYLEDGKIIDIKNKDQLDISFGKIS